LEEMKKIDGLDGKGHGLLTWPMETKSQVKEHEFSTNAWCLLVISVPINCMVQILRSTDFFPLITATRNLSISLGNYYFQESLHFSRKYY
jgi:hypothetical protein